MPDDFPQTSSVEQSSKPDVKNDIEKIDTDDLIAIRKQNLDELKFKLEERKSVHDMTVEMRKLDFVEREQQKQDNLIGVRDNSWLKTYWRPAMAWIYALICTCDFVIFPITWNLLQIYNKQPTVTAWSPLTLQGSGLIHIAFGAILGVSAWSRGKEAITAMSINSANSVDSAK